MKKIRRRKLIACAGLATAVLAGAPATAAQQTTAVEEVQHQQLKREIETQRKQLESQQRRIEQLELKGQQTQIEQLKLKGILGRGTEPAPPVSPPAEGAPATAVKPVEKAPTQVGKPPDTSRPPEVPALVDIRGVLTPRNTWIFEPSLQYSHSSNNRVALIGFTIIPAITIGLIDVRSVSRDTFIGAIAARYGVTNRFEVEAKVPYVKRNETTLSRPLATPSSADASSTASGSGIGDIELAGRYQLNQPGPDRAYYIAGLRVKTRTGKDPFEVETNPITGQQTQLPTGSGFYGVQPTLTAIFPSDPAVFFGNVSYLWNVARDIGNGVGKVDPGDAVGFTLGMGVALNDKASFSIAYDHATVFRTKQNGEPIPATSIVQLGTLLFGTSYRLGPKSTLNFTLGVGVTEEAPNVQLTVRLPFEL